MNKNNNAAHTTGQLTAGCSDFGSNRVYLDFYNLRETPFSITPDPEFIFLSNTYKSVIDKTLYGINNRMGFILLTGEVGTGKTTICRSVIDKLDDKARMVYIINPSVSGRELISGILDDLGLEYPPDSSKKDLINHLNNFLLSRADNNPVVIIIDDAQTMRIDALEDLRLLSNLETDKKKLLQMILVGQPELLEIIDRPEMRPLKQRVEINCRLEYLTRNETGGYIAQRLFIAGCRGNLQFTQKAINLIYAASNGIPRLINKICDYALTAGYLDDEFVIAPKHIKKSLKEIGDLNSQNGFANHLKAALTKQRVKTLALGTTTILVVFILIMFSAHLKNLNLLLEKWNKKFLTTLHTDKTIANETGPAEKTSRPALEEAIEKPSASPDLKTVEASVSSAFDPSPYILLLGSYKTLQGTLMATNTFKNKGLNVNWNYVDLGDANSWYRIFTGRFRTLAEAKQFKQDNGLKKAIIIFAPWVVVVGQCRSMEGMDKLQSALRDNLYDCYLEKCDKGGSRLLLGAFKTQAGAERLTKEVAKLNLITQVPSR
jgi:general secretion pathway protein A